MASTPPTHLIVLCCHALYHPSNPKDPAAHLSPASWLLQPFQSAEVPTFISHIRTALTILSNDPSSLLVISGSSTRPETPLSEAASYFNLLTSQKYFGLIESTDHPSLFWRIILEKRALDSFANLEFSLIEFWKRVGRWPEKVTIVSHGFKRERFMEVHVPALRFPLEKVEFVGIDPDYMIPSNAQYDEKKASEVKNGELERGLKPWRQDRLGKGKELREKRKGRNVWNTNQKWFENEDQRKKSGVKSEVISWVDSDGKEIEEEVILDAAQPWS